MVTVEDVVEEYDGIWSNTKTVEKVGTRRMTIR